MAGGFFTSRVTREAQEHWSGWPISSPPDPPDPGIEPGSPALQADSLPSEPPGKPMLAINLITVTAYCCITVALFTESAEEAELLLQWDPREPSKALGGEFYFLKAKLIADAWFSGFQYFPDSDFFFFLISTNSHLPSPLRVMEALPGMALASSIS